MAAAVVVAEALRLRQGGGARHQPAPPNFGDPGFGVGSEVWGSPSLSDEFIGCGIGTRGGSDPWRLVLAP